MKVLFAGVRVRHLGPAMDWYSRLFGRDPDVVPHDHEVMWRVSDGGWLYVLEHADGGGTGIVTISVADLEHELADLRTRAVAFGPVERVGDAALKATALDPDGNAIALVQVTDRG